MNDDNSASLAQASLDQAPTQSQASAVSQPQQPPPTWADVKNTQDYQGLSPADQLVAFSRWHDSTYNYLKTQPDWKDTGEKFNTAAADEQKQLGERATAQALNIAPEGASNLFQHGIITHVMSPDEAKYHAAVKAVNSNPNAQLPDDLADAYQKGPQSEPSDLAADRDRLANAQNHPAMLATFAHSAAKSAIGYGIGKVAQTALTALLSAAPVAGEEVGGAVAAPATIGGSEVAAQVAATATLMAAWSLSGKLIDKGEEFFAPHSAVVQQLMADINAHPGAELAGSFVPFGPQAYKTLSAYNALRQSPEGVAKVLNALVGQAKAVAPGAALVTAIQPGIDAGLNQLGKLAGMTPDQVQMPSFKSFAQNFAIMLATHDAGLKEAARTSVNPVQSLADWSNELGKAGKTPEEIKAALSNVQDVRAKMHQAAAAGNTAIANEWLAHYNELIKPTPGVATPLPPEAEANMAQAEKLAAAGDHAGAEKAAALADKALPAGHPAETEFNNRLAGIRAQAPAEAPAAPAPIPLAELNGKPEGTRGVDRNGQLYEVKNGGVQRVEEPTPAPAPAPPIEPAPLSAIERQRLSDIAANSPDEATRKNAARTLQEDAARATAQPVGAAVRDEDRLHTALLNSDGSVLAPGQVKADGRMESHSEIFNRESKTALANGDDARFEKLLTAQTEDGQHGFTTGPTAEGAPGLSRKDAGIQADIKGQEQRPATLAGQPLQSEHLNAPSDEVGAAPREGVVSNEEERTHTSFPQGREEPGGEPLRTDYRNIFNDENQTRKIAAKLRDYLPKDQQVTDDKKQIEHAITFMEDNQRALWERIQNEPWLHDAMRAYDDYNLEGQRQATKFGMPLDRIIHAFAAFSPQKSPDMGASMTERAADIIKNHSNDKWTDEMTKTFMEFAKDSRLSLGERKVLADTLKNKKFSELNDFQKALFVRAYDQTYNARNYPVVGVNGEHVGQSTDKLAWPSYDQISGGVQALEGKEPWQNLVSNKISNFFNNMIAPHSEAGDVTSDTHHGATSWLRPLGSEGTDQGPATLRSSKLLSEHFNGSKSVTTGERGFNSLAVEATRRLANELGVLPQELQAGLWFGQRGYMSRNALTKNAVEQISQLWDNSNHGKISTEEARRRAFDIADKNSGGKISPPEWFTGEKSGGAAVAGNGPAGNAGELSQAGGLPEGATRPGAGSEPAGGNAVGAGVGERAATVNESGRPGRESGFIGANSRGQEFYSGSSGSTEDDSRAAALLRSAPALSVFPGKPEIVPTTSKVGKGTVWINPETPGKIYVDPKNFLEEVARQVAEGKTPEYYAHHAIVEELAHDTLPQDKARALGAQLRTTLPELAEIINKRYSKTANLDDRAMGYEATYDIAMRQELGVARQDIYKKAPQTLLEHAMLLAQRVQTRISGSKEFSQLSDEAKAEVTRQRGLIRDMEDAYEKRFGKRFKYDLPAEEVGATPRQGPATIQRDIGQNDQHTAIPSDDRLREILTGEGKDVSGNVKAEKVGAHRDIAEGTHIGVRIDIPAYKRSGEYAQTIHDVNRSGGISHVLGYDGIVTLDNPKFYVSSEKAAQKIAEGGAKFPLATADGKYNKSREIPKDINDWTPVGFDPKEHSFFYDKRTDQKVEGGDKAIMVGNTAFVKNPVYGDRSQALFAATREDQTPEYASQGRKVSQEEFNAIKGRGAQHVADLEQQGQATTGLQGDTWEKVKDNAFEAAQKSWGGVTIDPKTGEAFQAPKQESGPFAVTAKREGQESVRVPENATKEEFNAAMEKAKAQFAQLGSADHYLGVFHDDKLGTIDIDPVIITKTGQQAEEVGAHTGAVGGAYDYATGNGLFPPQVGAAPRVQPRVIQPPSNAPGGIANAVQEARGTPTEPTEFQSAQDLIAKGASTIAKDPNAAPNRLAELNRTGQAASSEDFGLFMAHALDLQKAANASGQVPSQAEQDFAKQLQKFKSNWANQGQVMAQMVQGNDWGTLNGIRRAFLYEQGKPMTAKHEQVASDIVKEFAKSGKTLDTADANILKQVAETPADRNAKLPTDKDGIRDLLQRTYGALKQIGAATRWIYETKGVTLQHARMVQRYIKDTYLSGQDATAPDGSTYKVFPPVELKDILPKVASDLGMDEKTVLGFIAATQAKGQPSSLSQLVIERQAARTQQRLVQQAARLWMDHPDESTPLKVLDTLRQVTVLGHANAPTTHAGEDWFVPYRWKDMLWATGKSFKILFGNSKVFGVDPTKAAMAASQDTIDEMTANPNYQMYIQHGLESRIGINDQVANYMLDGYLDKIGLRGLTERGNLAMEILKPLRVRLADHDFAQLSPEEQKDPDTVRTVMQIINNETGIVTARGTTGAEAALSQAASTKLAQRTLFAGKLFASRMMNRFVNPVKMAQIYTRMATGQDVSMADQRFAKNVLRRNAWLVASYSAALGTNAAVLSFLHKDDKINISNPFASDFASFKWGGTQVSSPSNFLAPVRLALSVVGAPFVKGEDRKTLWDRLQSYATGQLNPGLNDMADMLAGKEIYSGKLMPWRTATTNKQKVLTWQEFGASKLPIPLAQAASDYYNALGEAGLSEDKANAITQASLGFISGSLGMHAHPEHPPKRPDQLPWQGVQDEFDYLFGQDHRENP